MNIREKYKNNAKEMANQLHPTQITPRHPTWIKNNEKLKTIYKEILSLSKIANQNTIEFKEKVREIQSGQRTANQAKKEMNEMKMKVDLV